MPTFSADIVLFDLDGTLVDTIPDLTTAVDAVLAALDRQPAGQDNVTLWIGNGMDKLLERALRNAGFASPDAALMDQARSHFQDTYGRCFADQSRLYPQVPETLAHLRAAGYGLGVVTNKPIAFTEPLLTKLGIRDPFGAVLGGDSLPRKKPDPAPLREAVRRIQPDAAHVVFVGDSVNDIQAARNAGYPAICLPYGYNHGRDIRQDHPDAIIATLAELPPLLHPPTSPTREPRHG